MKHPLIIGNWKLNGNCRLVNEFIVKLRNEIRHITYCDIAIAVPEVYLYLAKSLADGSNINIAAQNVGIRLSGPFTGETSARMLKDIGVKYVIIGHSDHRIYYKESEMIIAKKFNILKNQNLIPILCIGETYLENKSGKTLDVCAHQIDVIINNYGVAAFKDVVIAYEPIWAIGTGKSAAPEKIQGIHKFIREYIGKLDIEISKQVIIQYGGSVDSSNAVRLLTQPDIDGVLVGSASLKVDSFIAIVKAAELTK